MHLLVQFEENIKRDGLMKNTFTERVAHFIDVVKPQHRPEPLLLLADGHVSHTRNLDVIKKAKENNVILLIFS